MLQQEVDRLAQQIAVRNHPDVSAAIRARRQKILESWRARTVRVLPDLDHLTISEFEDSMAEYLSTLASAMASQDPDGLKQIITESPQHGIARCAQNCSTHTLLAEERIFRSVLILELREELGRPLTPEAAASLHELLDLMGEYSIMAMVAKRQKVREDTLLEKVRGMRRLADSGVLVASVAHDAMNILLPLRMHLEHLAYAELPDSAREDLKVVNILVNQFQNYIVNLRWISVDSTRAPGVVPPLDLNAWSLDIAEFHQHMIPESTELVLELPQALPPVRISSAALSQSVFNLFQNAQQAIASTQTPGKIVMGAVVREDGDVDLTIEDNGPGMPPEVLAKCTEAFFTTRHTGSGLGLTLVQNLIHGSGGEVTIRSPPPGKVRGTLVVLTLPAVGNAAA